MTSFVSYFSQKGFHQFCEIKEHSLSGQASLETVSTLKTHEYQDVTALNVPHNRRSEVKYAKRQMC